MSALTAQQEKNLPLPWQVEDAPHDFTEQLIQQIVGIEIPITRWQGKWKVSQNRPRLNRDSVLTHLEQCHQPDSEAMAEQVRTRLEGSKNGSSQ